MTDDDYDAPLYLGVGSCHTIDSSKPKRVRRKQLIGFVDVSKIVAAKKREGQRKTTPRKVRKR